MKKRIISLAFAIVLCLLAVLPAFAENGFDDLYGRVVDKPIVLTVAEREELSEKLDEIRYRQNMDVVVMITGDLEGMSIEDYAVDAYEGRFYGYGDDLDGVMLLIDIGTESWYIVTFGYAETVFTDSGIRYIGEQMKSYLSEGYYADAFNIYAEKCDEFITMARVEQPFVWTDEPESVVESNEEPVESAEPVEPADSENAPDFNNTAEPDNTEEPKKSLSLVWIPISLGVGILIAFLIVHGMKSKLKTVKKRNEANNYVRNGSLNINENYESFLYSEVSKTKIQKQNTSSNNGSNNSSSGTKHGGGGRKF